MNVNINKKKHFRPLRGLVQAVLGGHRKSVAGSIRMPRATLLFVTEFLSFCIAKPRA